MLSLRGVVTGPVSLYPAWVAAAPAWASGASRFDVMDQAVTPMNDMLVVLTIERFVQAQRARHAVAMQGAEYIAERGAFEAARELNHRIELATSR